MGVLLLAKTLKNESVTRGSNVCVRNKVFIITALPNVRFTAHEKIPFHAIGRRERQKVEAVTVKEDLTCLAH
jgi:hypothetical protein